MTLAKTNSKKPDLSAFSVFGSKPKNAILTPDSCINARNNCQSGVWTIGDEEYGKKLEMTVLKYSKLYGNLGQTTNTLWGQIFFITESGDLPLGVVMCTYIKSRSLNDFNRLIMEIQAKGIEPAIGIFTPEFVKQSGSAPDGKGGTQAVNYYSLKWTWKTRENEESLMQAAAVLADENARSRMVDILGTKDMICLDGLTQEEQERAIEKFNQRNRPTESTAITTTN
ncbi:MAG: hypothetical protein ACOVQ7_15745 [Limnoraphis robusta]